MESSRFPGMVSAESSTTTDKPTAIALSGGGSRASFHVGVLRYLYDATDFTAHAAAGASAGALLTAMICQAPDNDGQREKLDSIEELWRRMRNLHDMFTENPWYTRLKDRAPRYLDIVSPRPKPRRSGILSRSLSRVPWRGDSQSTDSASSADPSGESDAEDVAREAGPLAIQSAQDRPSSQRSTGAESDAATSPTLLRILGALPELTRAGGDLSTIISGAQRDRAMYRPGPLVDKLADPSRFTPEALASSGVEVWLAIVALESGELRYVNAHGDLLDRQGNPVYEDGEPVSGLPMIDAIRASCSIPGALEPVLLGKEHYVDGGTRENLPVAILQSDRQPGEVIAVSCNPPGPEPAPSFANKDMATVLLRTSTAIISDELLQDEVAYARTSGAIVIEPRLNVHDTLTIDPGLTALNIDYGYMRAAHRLSGADETVADIIDAVVEARLRAWAIEDELYDPDADTDDGPPEGANPFRYLRETRVVAEREVRQREFDQTSTQMRADLAQTKAEVAAAVARIDSSLLPPGAHRWAEEFEAHSFDIDDGVPDR